MDGSTMWVRWALILLVVQLASGAWAEAYVWYDAAGNPHLTDNVGSIPPEQRARATILRPEAEAPEAGTGPATRRERDPEAEPPEPSDGAPAAADEGEASFQWSDLDQDTLGIALILVLTAVIGAVYVRRMRDDDDEALDGQEVAAALLGFALLFGLVWGFGKLGAPLVWKEEEDRACQEEGYWYATLKSDGPYCEKWYVLPVRMGGRR